MEHYKNLMSALAGAMPVCMTWILAGTEDNYFNARDVFAFALSEGGEDEHYGVVSIIEQDELKLEKAT